MNEPDDGDETPTASLIALDWGTSTLRAYLLGSGGVVLDSHSESWGIMQLPSGGFPAALEGLTSEGGRVAPSVPAIASGMVGSARGWVEAPYCEAPAGAAELARALTSAGGGRLLIVPGV